MKCKLVTVFSIYLCSIIFSAPALSKDKAKDSDTHSEKAQQEWRYYGGDAGSSKYIPLEQINNKNVSTLKVAWVWDSVDNRLGDVTRQQPSYFKATPLMVNGKLYTSTGLNLVVAIDPSSGKTIWSFDPEAYAQGGRPANTGWQHRGVSYWEEGKNRRIFITTGLGELIALDAETGKIVTSFGENGRVDLQEGITEDDKERRLIGYSAPPVIVKNTIVVNCNINDGVRTIKMPTCHVRGFDVKTGKQKWIFHTVPQGKEPGVETWENNAWEYTGNTNSWSMSSVDHELGYVYVPTGTPTNDYYGGHRKGDNLYGESLLCIDAETGKLVWSFQGVHHGLWDYDFPAAPNLVDITVDGKSIKAVAQVSKQGFTYVFDRKTGKPVWPIVERPVPQSKIPGEKTSATQPFPTKPPAFARQGITEDDLIDFTPELKAAALEIVKEYQLGPLFSPPSLADGKHKGTIQVPSSAGGANWGGAGFDPETGYLFIQAANQPSYAALRKGDTAKSEPDYMGGGRAPDVTTLQGLPLLKPPYGTITAIDLNRGEIAWQVAHGKGPIDHPAIKHLNLPPLGNSSHSFLSNGGPLVTKTLVFFNQVQREFDSSAYSKTEFYLRAFDKANGNLVWEQKMDVPPFGTPMSYMFDGKQYLVVATGGAGEPAQLVAYSLP